MQIDLSPEDVRFLADQLTRHLQRVENELVHTDKRELQAALGRDLQRLKGLVERFRTPPEKSLAV